MEFFQTCCFFQPSDKSVIFFSPAIITAIHLFIAIFLTSDVKEKNSLHIFFIRINWRNERIKRYFFKKGIQINADT